MEIKQQYNTAVEREETEEQRRRNSCYFLPDVWHPSTCTTGALPVKPNSSIVFSINSRNFKACYPIDNPSITNEKRLFTNSNKIASIEDEMYSTSGMLLTSAKKIPISDWAIILMHLYSLILSFLSFPLAINDCSSSSVVFFDTGSITAALRWPS